MGQKVFVRTKIVPYGTKSVRANKKCSREQKMYKGIKKYFCVASYGLIQSFSCFLLFLKTSTCSVFCGILWLFVVFCGLLWPCEALFGLLWPLYHLILSLMAEYRSFSWSQIQIHLVLFSLSSFFMKFILKVQNWTLLP